MTEAEGIAVINSEADSTTTCVIFLQMCAKSLTYTSYFITAGFVKFTHPFEKVKEFVLNPLHIITEENENNFKFVKYSIASTEGKFFVSSLETTFFDNYKKFHSSIYDFTRMYATFYLKHIDRETPKFKINFLAGVTLYTYIYFCTPSRHRPKAANIKRAMVEITDDEYIAGLKIGRYKDSIPDYYLHNPDVINVMRYCSKIRMDHPEYFNYILLEYEVKQKLLVKNKRRAETLLETLEAKFQKRYSTPIYNISNSQSVTDRLIETIPINFLDTSKVNNWTENMLGYIETKYSDEEFFKPILNDAKVKHVDNVILKSYNTEDSIYRLNSTDVPKKELGSFDSKLVTRFGEKEAAFNSKEKCDNNGLNRLMCWSAHMGGAVFQKLNDNRSEGYWFVIDTPRGNISLDEFIDQYGIGISNEIINRFYDVTTIVVDIDFKGEIVDFNQVYKEIVSIGKKILNLSDITKDKCRHHIFKSKIVDANTKHGFHYHVTFPYRVGCSHQYAIDFINIFSELRRSQPNIGAYCGEDDNSVVDTKVWETQNHGIRTPYSSKNKNGDKKLECVYRDDGKRLDDLIDRRCRFIHYPNSPNGDGTCTLLTEISNYKFISDIKYLEQKSKRNSKNYIEYVLSSKKNNLLLSLSTHCVIVQFKNETFEDFHVGEYLQLFNHLWKIQGRSQMRKILGNIHRTGCSSYTVNEIESALVKSEIIYDSVSDNFLLVSRPTSKTFALCPARLHNCRHTPQINLCFNSVSMIKITLSVQSNGNFKRCSGSHIPLILSLKPFFFSDEIEYRVKQEFLTPFKRCSQVYRSKLDKDSNISFEPLLPENYSNPLEKYVKDVSQIRYVYACYYKESTQSYTTALRYSSGYLLASTNADNQKIVVVSDDANVFLLTFTYEQEVLKGILDEKDEIENIRRVMTRDKQFE